MAGKNNPLSLLKSKKIDQEVTNKKYNLIYSPQDVAQVSFTEQMCQDLLKIELHLHLEATISPKFYYMCAQKNKVDIPYKTFKEVQEAYVFKNPTQFLNNYSLHLKVLKTQEDFYNLAMECFQSAAEQNILHLELSIELQHHINNGIDPVTVLSPLANACAIAKRKWNLSVFIIQCFLRDTSSEEALNLWGQLAPYYKYIDGIGISGPEPNNPPSKFLKLFEIARIEHNKFIVTHAGESPNSQDFVQQTLELIKVDRIDHGFIIHDHDQIMTELAYTQTGLALVPKANILMGLVKDWESYPFSAFFKAKVPISISSGMPVYFGYNLSQTYQQLLKKGVLNTQDICQLQINSLQTSFLDDQRKDEIMQAMDKQWNQWLQNQAL